MKYRTKNVHHTKSPPLPRPFIARRSLATPANLLGSIARDPGARITRPRLPYRLFFQPDLSPLLPPSRPPDALTPLHLSFLHLFRPIIFVFFPVREPRVHHGAHRGALGTSVRVRSFFAARAELGLEIICT